MYTGERKIYYMKERVPIHSEWCQAFENMEVHIHIADVAIFLVYLTCMTNFHPVSSSDLNGNIMLFECDQDVWDLLWSNIADTGEKIKGLLQFYAEKALCGLASDAIVWEFGIASF